MDHGKRPSKVLEARNNKIYMDLKDIIREHTLPFLPAKSLFRFQGVCRDWKLQISTPFFAHNQSISFRSISGLFSRSLRGDPPSFIPIDPKSCGVPDPTLKFLPVPVDIRASSNGLLCCQSRRWDKAYYICNPVTKQWKKLPIQNADHGSDPAVVLTFEPSLLNFTADFKLICPFPSADFEDAVEFEIYSSTNGSWRISGEICFASRKLIPRSGVHVNGVVYWQAHPGGIIAFDLTKDRSQLIQGYCGPKGCLGMVGGKLCTAYASGRSVIVNVLANIYSNTMQMSSTARTWEEKYRIYLGSEVPCGAEFDFDQAVAVIFVGSDAVLVQSGKSIYSYELKTEETKALWRTAEYDATYMPCVNSLVYI